MLDRMRISFDEKSVLILGLALIALPILIELTGFRFTERLSPGKDLLSQSPIGEIIRQSRSVRKRREASTSFSSITPGESLFVGDRIMTGKGASARVNLTDGNILELGPESLIRIEPVRSLGFGGIKRKIKITLESGTVKAAVRSDGAPIVVENTRGEVILEALPPPVPPAPASLTVPPNVSAPAPEFVAVEAKSAQVTLPEIETSSGPSVPETAAPEKSAIQERPLLSRLTLALRPPPEEIKVLSSPKSGPLSEDVPLPDQKFKFQWKSVGYARETPYRIKIRESGRERVLESERETLEIPVPLAPTGDWEFQIETGMKSGEIIRSKPVQFNWSLPSPQPVSPADRSHFTSDQLRTFTKKFLLGWKELPACPKYRIDVGREELPIHSSTSTFETSENFIAIPIPESGAWKWKVTCVFAPGITSSGPVNRFEIGAGIAQ